MARPIDLSDLTGGEPADPSPGIGPTQGTAEDEAMAPVISDGGPPGAVEEEDFPWYDFNLVDALNAPFVAARPKPRGLLPVPSEVEEAVAEEEERLLKEHNIVPTPEARRRLVDSLTLQYYYGGYDVAYRETPQGIEVVAVGLAEIGELIRTTPQEQREGVVFGQG
jgi:hypothetical protein